jgi:transcription initiation factor IIE alpha subunit
MLEGRCPNCGHHCYGWVLRDPLHQTCPKCGSRLEIKDSGSRISEGCSPSTIDRSLLKQIMKIVNYEQKDRERDMKDE